jgi:hypothetical protein
MSQPTPERVAAATAILREKAAEWDRVQERLAEVGRGAPSLRITEYVDTTVFDTMLAGYNRLAATVGSRCSDGSGVADHIAGALRGVADVYDREEAANLHAQLNLF